MLDTGWDLYIVDVFAETRYAGNPLAVIRGGADLRTETLQQIAQEMNYSETTFILSDQPESGGYPVRIFTPTEELPFAGHPTLGTAFIIQQHLIGSPVEQLLLKLKVGSISVQFSYTSGSTPELLWMQQNPPQFGQTFDPAQVTQALGLSPGDHDDRFPIQVVSTGVPFIILPLRSLAALQQAQIDPLPYRALIENAEARWIHLFCSETHQQGNHLAARMFVMDRKGIWEDPATGSANGCLAGYLCQYRYFGQEAVDVRVEQGYEIGRPSLLLLRSERQADQISVAVGGRVIPVAIGKLV